MFVALPAVRFKLPGRAAGGRAGMLVLPGPLLAVLIDWYSISVASSFRPGER